MRGILFDKQGIFYSPVFSNKKRKRYRYYVSQNVLQHRDVASDFIDRFPAYEIESRVEAGIREHLSDTQLLNELLDFRQEKDQRLTRLISNSQHDVPIKKIVREAVAKVEAEREQLTIHIKTERLKQLLSKTLEVHIPHKEEDTLKLIQVPYITKWAHTHVAFVDGDSYIQKDPLDLPSKDLKNLVRGVVWRDEHFAGLTLREISQREQFSEGFVSKCIFGSFELLQAR